MSDTRFLFVISNDYGELGNAACILRQQDALLEESMLLLPPRLFETNKTSFRCPTALYSTMEDIVGAIETHRPDVVFLFSAYLFTVNGLLMVDSVAEIVRYSRAQGARVVTSDPFLGLLSAPLPGVMDAHAPFREIFEVLGDTLHFYPVPCDHLAPSAQVRALTTFNPRMLSEDRASESSVLHQLPAPAAPSSTTPTWLFILSAADYHVQTSMLGEYAFTSLLAARIIDVGAAGRRPVLLAPNDCLKALVARDPKYATEAELLSYCEFNEFTTRLLDAEAAFYWNMFSHSMLHRLLNEMPVFFFDRGHMGRHRVVYDTAVQNFFLGCEPVCLDQRKPLITASLSLVHANSRTERTRLSEHFQNAPDPEALIAEIEAADP